ncbi:undecaprenyl/decaprenyl-phosphate alpha-N-acetylglucosaminyl 1-phosphate transferase [Paracrocinitomix mangrovi]|uniref:MraY family glycosyltransferase n=1 Tax=Paracrocinitomix mangrovi TaxID=2862509 RepID=UPI001C8D56C4|nr:MraY family glycosyltransferase [Paracrocinitomix mangrovi]UKN02222.1 undecaprenyl/decaprenyl-phosphate alpha-N-acetylglucosaminyl 1-phosphate transferase [Paracrocinitomix mangrovi]
MKDSFESIINLTGFFGGAFLVSVLINRFLLKFAKSLGIRNKNDLTIRWSNESKPSLGGISFYMTFLLGFMIYAIVFGEDDVFRNEKLLGLFFTINIGFLLGLSDDAYDTKPIIKLLSQILCGVILVSTDSGIQLFNQEWLNITITVLWVVGIMNSINMLDNMDGITTIASIFIILIIIGISLPFKLMNNVDLFLLITTLGALSGFLLFNWNPSKMFMGDTGSQFLGMFLAYFSIKFLWNAGIEEGSYSVFSNLSLVLIAFSVPIMDTTFVTIRRLRKGKSPMVGGKDHTTHTLSYRGLTDRQVGYVFIILGIVSSLLAYNVANFIPHGSLSLILIWVYVLMLLIIFFSIAKKHSKDED